MTMDKFAVVLDDEKIKTASIEKKCPECGRELPLAQFKDNPSNVSRAWYCTNCGTRPFEKRPEPTK